VSALTTILRKGTSQERVLAPPLGGQEAVLIGVIAALWIALSLTTPAFMTPDSIRPLLAAVAPIALIGVGMTFVIVAAGIDISVAGEVMVCSVVVATLLVNDHISLIVALLVGLAIGSVLGSVNGVLVAYGRVHPIIITFGTANLFQFVGYQIFGSKTVNGIPNTLSPFGQSAAGATFGVPNAFLLTVIVAAAAWWYMRYTVGGRHYYAIGGDAAAARLAGVKVSRRALMAYLLTGALAGVAAIFVVASGTSTLDQSVGDHRWTWLGAGYRARRHPGADRHVRCHPAQLAQPALQPLRRRLRDYRRRCRPHP
jgi:ribose transport system permease protein